MVLKFIVGQKLENSYVFNYFENINFLIIIFLGLSPQPIFSFGPFSATETNSGRKVLQEPLIKEVIAKDASLLERLHNPQFLLLIYIFFFDLFKESL